MAHKFFSNRYLIASLLSIFFLPTHAAVLLSENFDSATIANALTISGDPLNNLGTWIDFPDTNRWGISSDIDCTGDCNGNYARHLVQTSDNTNSLFYGIDYAVSAGETFTVDFDYVASNRNGRVALLGLTAGSTALDPFAPFWYNGDPNDGESLFTSSEEVLSSTSVWDDFTWTGTATADYDALAFTVVMGGTSGVRGIDNVQINSVPEPSTLLLMATSLAGLGFASRKKKQA